MAIISTSNDRKEQLDPNQDYFSDGWFHKISSYGIYINKALGNCKTNKIVWMPLKGMESLCEMVRGNY